MDASDEKENYFEGSACWIMQFSEKHMKCYIGASVKQPSEVLNLKVI